jgi:hypothetical protein
VWALLPFPFQHCVALPARNLHVHDMNVLMQGACTALWARGQSEAEAQIPGEVCRSR